MDLADVICSLETNFGMTPEQIAACLDMPEDEFLEVRAKKRPLTAAQFWKLLRLHATLCQN